MLIITCNSVKSLRIRIGLISVPIQAEEADPRGLLIAQNVTDHISCAKQDDDPKECNWDCSTVGVYTNVVI